MGTTPHQSWLRLPSAWQWTAACCLVALQASSHASTLSWHDAPIMGSNVDASVPGQFTVTVNGALHVIPDSNSLPSQSTFLIDPTAFDGTHFHDPSVYAYAVSAVNIDLGSDYVYTGNWAFLGNGANAAYDFNFPSDIWMGSWGLPIAELYSSVGDFWLEDVGTWRYTETWTGTSGADAGVSITSSRDFTVALVGQVPEPPALLLLGLAMAGLASTRRLRSRA